MSKSILLVRWGHALKLFQPLHLKLFIVSVLSIIKSQLKLLPHYLTRLMVWALFFGPFWLLLSLLPFRYLLIDRLFSDLLNVSLATLFNYWCIASARPSLEQKNRAYFQHYNSWIWAFFVLNLLELYYCQTLNPENGYHYYGWWGVMSRVIIQTVSALFYLFFLDDVASIQGFVRAWQHTFTLIWYQFPVFLILGPLLAFVLNLLLFTCATYFTAFLIQLHMLWSTMFAIIFAMMLSTLIVYALTTAWHAHVQSNKIN